MKKGVSIIICCYNSASRLHDTLRHIFNQKVPDEIPWELIIVNNNSTDSTKEIAITEWGECNRKASFQLVDEPKPGLSYARKAGISAAKYTYSIFCDDDNWLDSEYVHIAYNVIVSNPSIGMLGGQSESVCEINEPEWFEEKKCYYAVGKQAGASCNVTTRGYLWGASIVLRTEVLRSIYSAKINSLLTDRTGNDLSSGGDAEISKWFILLGYRLWYDERLLFKHYIPKERLTSDYFDNLMKGQEKSSAILLSYKRYLYYKEYLSNHSKILLLFKTLLKVFFIKLGLRKYTVNRNHIFQNLQLCLNSYFHWDHTLAKIQIEMKKLNEVQKAN
jgi:glycosyltransferase involved in cell wall biosynthesis